MKTSEVPYIAPPSSGDRISVSSMAEGIVSDAEKRPKAMEDLVVRTQEARKMLFESFEGIGAAVEKFKPMSDEYVRELRAFNVAAVFELKNTLNTFSELRKFFLDNQHVEEIKRLREFIELCERLKSLKDSGFLDAVADTILKL